MRFRKRRRGRRKPAANSTVHLVKLILLLVNVLAIGTLAFSNEDHNLEHQNNHEQNHYEEPLALASNEDASQDSQQTRQNRGKRTLYACEEKQLEIDCQLGESIQLIRANYGRFSIQICNEHGQLDWKVNCMSSDSYDIIARSCQSKQSCQLLASNEIFGDACPGTQKYLEVHYQCVPANRTQPGGDLQQPKVNQIKQVTSPTIKKGNNVIQQPQLSDAATTASNSEISTQIVTRPTWMGPATPTSSPKQLPNWITDASLNPYHLMGRLAPSSSSSSPQTPQLADPTIESSTTSNGVVLSPKPGHCPEIVWRSIRWPETEAGQLAHRPCPAHAFPMATDSPTSLVAAASLLCQPNGQWSERSNIPGRCCSYWLRNLTQRMDTGDSPLSILSELVYRTQSSGKSVAMSAAGQGQASAAAQHNNNNNQPTASGSGSSAVASWIAYATSSLTSQASGQTSAKLDRFPLFGEDLKQMYQIVGRLVDKMGELLSRISDDKQRITFAREMIQLIVELTSNLLLEEHSQAWSDLDTGASNGMTGERQHVAGRLLETLNAGCVLLAGALQHQPRSADSSSDTISIQEDFQKITDHVYVAIQSYGLDLKQPGSSQRLQVTFPSQTSIMGARWINSDQRFTLNLQASNLAETDQQQTGQTTGSSGQQQLKIVSVMVRGLGVYMEPAMIPQKQLVQDMTASSDKSSPGDSSGRSLAVNSDIVGFSIVADSTRSPTRVDLTAPIELVFRHNNLAAIVNSGSSLGQHQPPTVTGSGKLPTVAHCVHWNETWSDWSTDGWTGGCKLVATNRTHSVCACDHLATFGLLNELDMTTAGQQQTLAAPTTSGPGDHESGFNSARLARVHLDNVESGIAFDGQTTNKAIYMARLLDGYLFTSQTSTRGALYASCCLSGLLLALLLAAAAYNRAHTRRLLGSLPAEPPPSLLVANYHNHQLVGGAGDRMLQQASSGLQHANGQNSIETSTTNGASPPTSYSSGGQPATTGVDLLATKQEAANILGHDDELNGFYSLLGPNNSTAGYYGPPEMPTKQSNYTPESRRHHRTKSDLSQLAVVPVHLIVQLLLLQLLLLLLIESQNLLAWNSQQAKRSFMQTSFSLLSFNQFSFSTSMPLDQQQQDQQLQHQLDPIGLITWLAVFALYYLVSTLVCWLLSNLIQLNGRLIRLNTMLGLQPNKQYQTIQTISNATIYHQQQPINRYGQCQIHHNNTNNATTQAASSSPSLSNFSNPQLTADLTTQQHQQLGGRLEHLESRQSNKEQPLFMRQSLARSGRHLQAGHDENAPLARCSLGNLIVRISTSDQLANLLVHLGPVLMSCLLVWLTFDRAQLVNLVAYTNSWASQLAYWPLVLNAGWTMPLVLHLYCLPSICLALGVVALAMLRRQFSQIYKSQTANGQFGALNKRSESRHHLESESAHMADAKSHQQQRARQLRGGQLVIELAIESKRAKFACLTLLALLALNSICWISFFIQCHQALNQTNTNDQQQAPNYTSGNHLILTFASSNLLISLLICCSHRKQLKRACQLLGLARFVSLASGHCCQLGEATKSSPASTSSVSSSSYYNHQNGHHGDQHQSAAMHYGTGKSIKISSAPSQQSLFVISRSRPVGGGTGGMLAEIAQPTYNGAQQNTYGGPLQHNHLNYPVPATNQHLYQQLAAANSQQHIYDSTTNLNSNSELVEQHKQRQLNAFHLMAQQQQQQQNHRQQQQFNQQEPMIHYTLGRPFNGSQFHLNQQQQQQQQYFHAGNMTLKPIPSNVQQQQQQMSFAPQHHQQGGRNVQHDSIMCPISEPPGVAKTHSASSSGRQQQHAQSQQQQQLSASSSSGSSSGEADGPLVALAQTTTPTLNKRRHEFSIATANQSTSPATFGPMHHTSGMITSNNNNTNSQQATEHRPSNNSDNQSFVQVIGHGGSSGASGNHCVNSFQAPAGKPIKHNNNNNQADQHLGKQAPASSQNYTDALKAAIAQEANQQHFRRTNSTAMRQHQQPHRSFACPTTGTTGSAMMDAQLDYEPRSSRFGAGQTDMLASGAVLHDGNIYDVANCGPIGSR